MRSTLSILGLYNYDAHIFDDLSLPEGVDKDTVVHNILLENAELEVLYPNPDTMRQAVKWWSLKQLPEWERMWRVLQQEYDPLMNYDRTEDWEDQNEAKEDTTAETTSGTETDTTTTGQSNGTSTNQPSGYNSDGFTNGERTITTDQNSASGNAKTTGTETGTGTRESQETRKRTGRAYGNIGVTTSQQMLNQELDVAVRTIYATICDEFRARFCLLIY